MALGIYAGATINAMTELPSPDEVNPTFEIIWSEDTGRAQSGANQAMMIGDVVAEKRTYSIKWGVIEDADMTAIKNKLTAGFFYFAVATSLANAKSSALKYYRSEISGDYLPIGNDIYWKGVSVQVIEQ